MNGWKDSLGNFDPNALMYQLPFLLIVGFGLLVLVLEAFSKGSSKRWLMWVAVVGIAAGFIGAYLAWKKLGVMVPGDAQVVLDIARGAAPPSSDIPYRELFDGMLIFDRFGVFMNVVFLVGALLTVLLVADYMKEHGFEFGEVFALILFATAGMMLLAAANDLITVFLGLETMSLAVYVLTGSWRRSPKSAEAAMKYFLMGAFATGLLLYGIALIYGVTGATNLHKIAIEAPKVGSNPLFLIGVFLVIVAFGFKIAAVPFHMWAPDAYEGAPTPVTAFMAAGVKAAAFAGLLRFFGHALGNERLVWGPAGWGSLMWILAIATMTLGNLSALRQDNIKRMLAYSSIAHAGYLLIGVVAAGFGAKTAQPAVLFYLLAYTFTTIGAFGVVAWLGNRGDERLLVDDWAGLGSRHPAAAMAMTIFMLSLAGMPPTAGFFGKFYIFRAAMEAHQQLAGQTGMMMALVVIAVVNSLISVYYYLRIVMAMYFREPARETSPLRSPAVALALIGSALFVLQMGLLPSRYLDMATQSLIGR